MRARARAVDMALAIVVARAVVVARAGAKFKS